MRGCLICIAAWVLFKTPVVASEPTLSVTEARHALHRVVSFYRNEVGYNGAYLWRYAADLSAQEGEGSASRTSGWTQPPGTPAVGQCYLDAWRLTGDDVCREAAIEAAQALVQSQLMSGGWSSHFDLSRRTYNYRFDGDKNGRNRTTFDDNKTQSAMMLLMHVDEALEFRNADIHECVQYGLQHILAAQYPNGAWPQQFSAPPVADDYPVVKASYPATWPRHFPEKKYTRFYTLNDNNMSHIIDMLLEANRIYKKDVYAKAAIRTADFFLLAQMPEPQPGWAQQYDANMHPVWARKFEPPAVTGGESQSVIRKLIDVYRFTGEQKFIETVPKALAYFRKSELPDGRLARFYELKSNRPLFFTKTYELTYDDGDMPTHYSFKTRSGLDSLERHYQRAIKTAKEELRVPHRHLVPVARTNQLAEQASEVVSALDSRGAWVESGKMRHQDEPLDVINMRTLIRNLQVLARYAGSHE